MITTINEWKKYVANLKKINEAKKVQSISDGSTVIFKVKDLSSELAETETDEDLPEGFYKAHNGMKATINSLETYTELGNKDCEYYNIKFEDGKEVTGISGYHLDYETNTELMAVYQGPKTEYKGKLLKIVKEKDHSNTAIIDEEGRKLLNIPDSDLRFVKSINVGKDDDMDDDRIGDDPMSKQYFDRTIKRSNEAKVDTIYTIEMENSGSGFRSGPSRYYYQTGTLAELIDAYSYTLETGKSYEHEKGNKKINMIPKNIQALLINLNNAVNNSAANGYAGKNYRLLPEGEEKKGQRTPVSTSAQPTTQTPSNEKKVTKRK